ncbi:MAG: ATP synthase F1 subunit gamma [Gemmatimonadetes bacterium]|nr:ATP synthase F1 subunit gamma [Gemmatimonadota bacterium]
MAKSQDIKRRIRSVEKTRQITRTMEMVATSKLKKMSDLVHAARPYSERLGEVIGRLTDPELRERYPLLRQPETARRAAVLLLTSNRGLAGAFNVNLIREARQLMQRLRKDGTEVELHVVGKKGIGYFRFQGVEMASRRMDVPDRREPEHAAELVDELRERFAAEALDAVYVVYAQYRSALSTPPRTLKVLPVEPPQEKADEAAGSRAAEANYILSPGADAILNELLPLYVRNSVYRALVETAAAEQGARRTAMKNATDNAGDILDNLRRTYNRARQAQITQEIAEIVGGAAALE